MRTSKLSLVLGMASTLAAAQGAAMTLVPANVTVQAGQTVVVTVTGGPAPNAYIDIGPGVDGIIAMPDVRYPSDGTTSVSFPVTGLTPGTASLWFFAATIGGRHGSWPIDGTITVVPSSGPCSPPTIIQQPGDAVFRLTTGVSLGVTGMSVKPVSYQWFVGMNSGPMNAVTGATTRTFPFVPTALGTYQVRAVMINECGSAESRIATIQVDPCLPPIITQQPRSQIVTIGASVTLTFDLLQPGDNSINVIWFNGHKGDTSNAVTGGYLLIISPVTHSASYWARITNLCGTTDSDEATITAVPAAPDPSAPPSTVPVITNGPQDGHVQQGRSITLTVSSTGAEPLVYQWFAGTSVANLAAVPGAARNVFVFTPPRLATYYVQVTVTNSYGAAQSRVATLRVDSPSRSRAVRH